MEQLKKECFAYIERGGVPRCAVLKDFYNGGLNCRHCPFYKTQKQFKADFNAAAVKNKELQRLNEKEFQEEVEKMYNKLVKPNWRKPYSRAKNA